MHDARVFKNSPLFALCCARTFLPADMSVMISGVRVPPLILGDSAYTLSEWLMKPYTDRGNLTPEDSIFNIKHISLAVFCTITMRTCMSFSMTSGSIVSIFMLEFSQMIQTKGRTLNVIAIRNAIKSFFLYKLKNFTKIFTPILCQV